MRFIEKTNAGSISTTKKIIKCDEYTISLGKLVDNDRKRVVESDVQQTTICRQLWRLSL